MIESFAPKAVSAAKMQRWMPEASPMRAEMLRALDAGQVRGEIFRWPK